MSDISASTPQTSNDAKTVIASLALIFFSIVGILAFIQWRWHWLTLSVIVSNGIPYWTYLIPLLAAFVGALVPSLLAYFAYQKFKEERDQRERIHKDQQETSRLQFERKHLEEQFNDIQNRLSDGNDAIRANAALRLAQLAQTLRPGNETTDYTIENYRYFPRATSQLSIAINMEKNAGVRSAIVKAIYNLMAFAGDKPGEELLDFLTYTLADTNRTAHHNFLKTLAAYWVAQPQAYLEKTWEQLGIATFFCDDIEFNKSILETQMQHPSFQGDYSSC